MDRRRGGKRLTVFFFLGGATHLLVFFGRGETVKKRETSFSTKSDSKISGEKNKQRGKKLFCLSPIRRQTENPRNVARPGVYCALRDGVPGRGA